MHHHHSQNTLDRFLPDSHLGESSTCIHGKTARPMHHLRCSGTRDIAVQNILDVIISTQHYFKFNKHHTTDHGFKAPHNKIKASLQTWQQRPGASTKKTDQQQQLHLFSCSCATSSPTSGPTTRRHLHGTKDGVHRPPLRLRAVRHCCCQCCHLFGSFPLPQLPLLLPQPICVLSPALLCKSAHETRPTRECRRVGRHMPASQVSPAAATAAVPAAIPVAAVGLLFLHVMMIPKASGAVAGELLVEGMPQPLTATPALAPAGRRGRPQTAVTAAAAAALLVVLVLLVCI